METLETLGGNTKTPKVRPVPSKKWCFTAYGDEMETLETKIRESKKTIKYIIGNETCPETGRKHKQGYIEAENKIRPVEHFETKTVHWEKTKGSRQENIKYCQKEGDYKTNFDIKDLYEIL